MSGKALRENIHVVCNLRKEAVARSPDQDGVEAFIDFQPAVEVFLPNPTRTAEHGFSEFIPLLEKGSQLLEFMVCQEAGCLSGRKGLEQVSHIVDFRNLLSIEGPYERSGTSDLFDQPFAGESADCLTDGNEAGTQFLCERSVHKALARCKIA